MKTCSFLAESIKLVFYNSKHAYSKFYRNYFVRLELPTQYGYFRQKITNLCSVPITILLITRNATSQSARLKSDEMKVSRLREVDWLLQKEQLDQDDNVSWSAYFAHLHCHFL